MTTESESRRILSEEQKAKLETMEENLRRKISELFALTSDLTIAKKDHDQTKQALESTHEILAKTEIVLETTKQNLAEETRIREAHQETERKLHQTGGKLLSTLGRTVKDVDGLHAKLKRKSDLQAVNRNNWQDSHNEVVKVTGLVESKIDEFQTQQRELIDQVLQRVQAFVQDTLQTAATQSQAVDDFSSAFGSCEESVTKQSVTAQREMSAVLEEIKDLREEVKTQVSQGLQGLSDAAGRISAGVISELERFRAQLFESYSALGKDVRITFDDLVRTRDAQRADVESLKTQLITATTAGAQAEERLEKRLGATLDEERQQAATDRRNLLAQITSLVNENGKAQEERLATKINTVRTEMQTTRSDLTLAEKSYADGMQVWSRKEDELSADVRKARDALKTKLQTDWSAVAQRHDGIADTTRSVHEATVSVVDTQLAAMDVQMQALDDFVRRARAQNDRYAAARATALGDLVSVATRARDRQTAELTSASARAEALATAVEPSTSALGEALALLPGNVSGPLTALGATIAATPLAEYVPTGSTPARTAYAYPTTLPRTQLTDDAHPSPSKGDRSLHAHPSPHPDFSRSFFFDPIVEVNSELELEGNGPLIPRTPVAARPSARVVGESV